MFKTPVLFLIFNRPEISQEVFKVIAEVKPEQLFIAADGPRLNNQEDILLCQKTREAILKLVDWPCELKTLFREKNLGCGLAVSQGISWFFSHVEAGIILEDDCLPNQDFFLFCQKMIQKYNNYPNIGMISGTNFLLDGVYRESYFFSKYFSVCGWATWKKKWELYTDDLSDWNEIRKSSWLNTIFSNKNVVRFYIMFFDKLSERFDNTWDYWIYSLLRADQLTITPTKNLISNIGFEGAFMEKNHFHFLNLPLKKLDTNFLIEPNGIMQNIKLDALQFHNSKIDRFSLKVYFRVMFRDSFILSIAYKIKNMLHI